MDVKISKHILFTAAIFLFLQSACNEKHAATDPPAIKMPPDSILGIGNKIASFKLPGRLIAVNPDSGNRVIIIGEEGKVINTIYTTTGSEPLPEILNKVAVDSASMDIYVYKPLQHNIFVYDENGNYKSKVYIKKVHNGSFFSVMGKFLLVDKDSLKEGDAKAYIVDSTGRYVDGF